MSTGARVLDALGGVRDPELDEPITELIPLFQKFWRFSSSSKMDCPIGREPAIEYSGARPWNPDERNALPAI